ncbi:hypothetical protein GOP47_0002629 [Adiantum capillus-veneris]|uniref:Endoglucanase n=1 Tax=Adiantum capillus-veneris TaxID=13818 RepID=A0A9D4ZR44_ADICA|nr:hypothetical protein GOP47_0002629 [Adiantum capillus-veneris]
MGVVSRSTKGCFWWVLVLGIAALVVAAAVVTLVIKHKKSGSGSSSHEKAPYLGSATYSEALSLSLTFLDMQKSGKLPEDNPIGWRGDSALNDGEDVGLDLTGGMYDAGDHIKFSFPMAFTSTLLSWSVLEYSSQMAAAKQLNAAKSNIKWITDYLLKTHPSSNELYFQVGDPSIDHACWQRPEDMDDSRPSYMLNTSMPGSEVAAEVAAAMASASLVFRKDQASYSENLLKHARELFHFANTSRDSYTSSYPVEQTYYNSTSYGDELLWAASWLYHATGEDNFLTYATGSDGELYAEWEKAPAWLSWDNKVPGVQVLLSRQQYLSSQGGSSLTTTGLTKYKKTANELMCALLPDSPTATKDRTDGGLIWVIQWNPIQHAVNSALLALIYSDYLYTSKSTLDCSGESYSPEDLRSFSISQANYLLGKNPAGISYLVGYGSNFPQKIHHRAASIPSDSKKYGCKDGFVWLSASDANPHIAEGALVGGPFQNDSFVDSRNNTMQNEPTTYNTAALVGLMAGLTSSTQVTLSSWA